VACIVARAQHDLHVASQTPTNAMQALALDFGMTCSLVEWFWAIDVASMARYGKEAQHDPDIRLLQAFWIMSRSHLHFSKQSSASLEEEKDTEIGHDLLGKTFQAANHMVSVIQIWIRRGQKRHFKVHRQFEKRMQTSSSVVQDLMNRVGR